MLLLTNVLGRSILGISESELSIIDNDFAPGQFYFEKPNYSQPLLQSSEYQNNITFTQSAYLYIHDSNCVFEALALIAVSVK